MILEVPSTLVFYGYRKIVAHPSRGHGKGNTWAAEQLLACVPHTKPNRKATSAFQITGKTMLTY